MSKRRGGSSVRPAPQAHEATSPAPPPAEAAALAHAGAHGVLVFESAASNRRRAEELLVSLGYRVELPESADEALRRLEGDAPPDLVVVGLPGGEAVARAIKARSRGRAAALVVACSGETGEALAMVESHGADSFVLRPYKRDTLAAVLRAAAAARGERQRRFELDAELELERSRLLRHGEADPRTGFYHFEFFKRVLVIELKRAKRYGYSLAAALVQLDDASVEGASAAARGELTAQVARALHTVVRDIDLPVDYAEGRFLVFLPYTDLAGAERVGRRIEAAVRRTDGVADGGRQLQPTVSVGIAALKQGGVSFAKLMRDASMALRAAQLKGGGRVVVKP
jgi:diguanylate cyclase (GGDEF)-like protein